MLAILVMAQFMALLDATIVNVAIPSIQTNMHASGAGLQFIVAGYTVAYAMLLITGARLGRCSGTSGSSSPDSSPSPTASLLCGIAPTTGVLIASRVVQGIGAAAMVPQTLSIIQTRFTGASRTRAFSVYGAAISIGGVTGQVLGGVLVDLDIGRSAWRSIFFVNVPVGMLAVILATRKLPRDGRSSVAFATASTSSGCCWVRLRCCCLCCRWCSDANRVGRRGRSSRWRQASCSRLCSCLPSAG